MLNGGMQMVVLLWCNQSIFETLLEVFLSGCKSDLVVVGVIFLENDPNCLNNLQIIFGNFHKSVENLQDIFKSRN